MIPSFLTRMKWLRRVYPDLLDRRRAQGIMALVMLGLIVWFVSLVVVDLPNLLESGFSMLFARKAATPLLIVLVIVLLRRGYLLPASWFVVLTSLIPMVLVLDGHELNRADFIIVALPIVAAGLLLGYQGFIVTLLAVLVAVAGLILREYEAVEQVLDTRVVGGVVVTVILAVMFLLFRGDNLQFSQQGRIEIRQLEQLRSLRFETTADHDSDIIGKAIELLNEMPNFNFTQVFMIDQDGRPTQRVRRGYQSVEVVDITLGEVSAITEAAQTEEIIEISVQDAQRRRIHMMPFSTYAMAVPVHDGEHVTAVLDVQSNDEPFEELDRVRVRMLAEYLGATLRDARLIRTLRSEVTQQQVALDGLRSQVRQMHGIAEERAASIWDTYFEQRGKQSIGYDLDLEGGLIANEDLPEDLRDAVLRGEVVSEVEGDMRLVIAPIILQNEVLGGMSFHLPADQPFTERQVEMVQNVAQRLAIALENRRLLEQSRLQADRERTANEVGNALLSATETDHILDVAALMFNEVMGAIHTSIYLRPGTSRDQVHARSVVETTELTGQQE